MANYVQKGGKVVLKDAILFLKTLNDSGQLVSLALKFADGNFTWEETDTYEYSLDRGKIDDVREGDETPLSCNFSGAFTHVRSDGSENITPHEILRARKYADYNPDMACADFVGYQEPWLMEASTCPPYASELELHVNPRFRCPNQQLTGEAFLFRYFRCETLSADVSGGTISANGKCNIVVPCVLRKQFVYDKFADAECLDPTEWPDDPRE